MALVSVGFFVAIFVVIMLYLVKKKKDKLLSSGMDKIDTMDGVLFEELILEHFRHIGYKGKLTPATGDYGADIIVQNGHEKMAIQVKRYNQNVGIDAVQQIIGAVNYYSANRGMVITNSFFTNNAVNLASSLCE